MTLIRNSKLEIRNSKQMRLRENPKPEARNPKQFRLGENPKSETQDVTKVRTFRQEEGSKPHDLFRSLLFSDF